MRLGPKISKTVKGKLRLQAGSLQIEGVKSVFKKTFSVGKEERLLKASSPRMPVKEFWLLFHRFLNYQKAFNHLQQAIS